MNNLRIFCSLLLLVFGITDCIPQKNKASHEYFFVQITDPQLGFSGKNNDFTREAELYEKTVTAINKLRPDFVIITGDLVNKTGDRAQTDEFKRITSKISREIPVYYSPGNHDIGQSPSQDDIDQFRADYSDDKFVLKHRKSVFVGINSCYIKSNMVEMEQKQFEWIKRVLSKAKNARQIIVFTHYPFFMKSFDEPENYSNIPPEIRMKYISLFKKYGVDAVFSGHLHDNASAEYEGIEFITTSASGIPLGTAPSGLRIVKITGNEHESSYYSLDEILK